MEPITIRVAEPTDAESLATLNNTFNESTVGPEHIADYLADCQTWLEWVS